MKRFLRRFLIVVGAVALVLAVMVGAFYGIENWRGAHAWAAVQREARAQGGTTEYAEIIPPPIPDGENLAMAPFFVRALDYRVDPVTKALTFGYGMGDHPLDGMPYGKTSPKNPIPHPGPGWDRGCPLDLAVWQKYYRADPVYPHTPDPRSPAADVRLALSRYAAPLDELARAAAERLRSRFPINWMLPSPYGIALPHGNLLQILATTLRLRSCAELADGDPVAAADDIGLAFRLSRAVAADPLVIDHLVSITIIGLTIQPVWEGLAARRWDAGELARLQAILSQEDVLADYAQAMRSEVGSTGRGLDFLEQHRDHRTLNQIISPWGSEDATGDHRWLSLAWAVAPRGWYDQNKARTADYLQTYVLGPDDPAAHRADPAKLAAGIAARSAVRLGPYTLFYLLAAPVFDSLLPRSARTQTLCDQAATACALERFYLDHQSYPADLAVLVPAYLGHVPTDVIDGAPMRYRRTDDGRYLLYGVGWNGRDDGGVIAWKDGPRLDDKAGDWVWQYQPLQPPTSIQRNK